MSASGDRDELDDRASEGPERSGHEHVAADRWEAKGPFMLRESAEQESSQAAEMEQAYAGEVPPVERLASCGHGAGCRCHEQQERGETVSESAPVGLAEAWPEVVQHEASGTQESEREGGASAVLAGEHDRYFGIRTALSPEHANLTSDEITSVFGRRAAVIALQSLLGSPALREATMAALLGQAGSRAVFINGAEISIPSYLRLLSRLADEAAEHSLAELEVSETPGSSETAVASIPETETEAAIPRTSAAEIRRLQTALNQIRAGGQTVDRALAP
jgi:hypothetical protein